MSYLGLAFGNFYSGASNSPPSSPRSTASPASAAAASPPTPKPFSAGESSKALSQASAEVKSRPTSSSFFSNTMSGLSSLSSSATPASAAAAAPAAMPAYHHSLNESTICPSSSALSLKATELLTSFGKEFPETAGLIAKNPHAIALLNDAAAAGTTFQGFSSKNSRAYTDTIVGSPFVFLHTSDKTNPKAGFVFLFELNNAINSDKFTNLNSQATIKKYIEKHGGNIDKAKEDWGQRKFSIEVQGSIRTALVSKSMGADYQSHLLAIFDKTKAENPNASFPLICLGISAQHIGQKHGSGTSVTSHKEIYENQFVNWAKAYNFIK